MGSFQNVMPSTPMTPMGYGQPIRPFQPQGPQPLSIRTIERETPPAKKKLQLLPLVEIEITNKGIVTGI